jgi:Fe2+ or Zn2+ uptake regulation protein
VSCSETYIPELHARGFRMTPQRMAILHVLRHSGGHLAPVQVYERACRELPGLTEPTVYRTLEFLAANGLVQQAHVGSGRMVYQIAARAHHHLICRSCGQEVELEHAALARLYHQLETGTGFRLTDGHHTFFGLCPDCQKN